MQGEIGLRDQTGDSLNTFPMSDLPESRDTSVQLGKDMLFRSEIGKSVLERAKQYNDFQEGMAKLVDEPFKAKLLFLLDCFPTPSLFRDEIIEELLNSCYTTWNDIAEAEQKLTKNSSPDTQMTGVVKSVNTFTRSFSAFSALFMKPEDMVALLVDRQLKQDEKTVLVSEIDKVNGDAELQLLLRNISKNERKLLIQELCLGENGLFLDEHFNREGRALLRVIFDYMEVKIDSTQFVSNRQMLEQALFIGLSALRPEKRMDVLLVIIDTLQVNEDQGVAGEQVLVQLLDQFVVGTKLLQMDTLIPKSVQDLAVFAKEGKKPESKCYLMQQYNRNGRVAEYHGVGPYLAAASTACVYPLSKTGEKQGAQILYDTVVKILRSDFAEDSVDEEIEAFKSALKYIADHVKISVDLEDVFETLKRALHEELSPLVEAANTKVLSFLRVRGKSSVKIPKLKYRSNNFIELSMAPGVSLSSLEKGDRITNKQEHSKIAKRIVQDFFEQVFEFGIFNADEHSGNIFVNPSRLDDITIIDHGQVGIVDLNEDKKQLFILTVGIQTESPKLVAHAMSKLLTISDAEMKNLNINTESILNQIESNTGTLVERTMKTMALLKTKPELTLYLKALVSILPLVQELKAREKAQLALPYVRKFGIERELLSNFKPILSHIVNTVFLGKEKVPVSSVTLNSNSPMTN